MCRQYLAIALILGAQAVALRTFIQEGHYDARRCLSPATAPLYEAIYAAAGRRSARERPFIWNDDDQPLDELIEMLAKDIADEGKTVQAVEPLLEEPI